MFLQLLVYESPLGMKRNLIGLKIRETLGFLFRDDIPGFVSKNVNIPDPRRETI